MPYADKEKNKECITRYRLENKEKIKNQIKKWKIQNPEKVKISAKKDRQKNQQRVVKHRVLNKFSGVIKRSQNKYRYGITKDISLLIEEQSGKCSICEKQLILGKHAIDHDHTNKKYRSILCMNCNVMLGHAREDCNILQKAINYLRKHEKTTSSAT